MTPEGRVKAQFFRLLKAAIADGLPCYWFSPVQTGLGSATLDCLLSVNGNFVAIEFKANKTKTLTPRQQLVQKQIEANKGIVRKVFDTDSAVATVEFFKRLPAPADRIEAKRAASREYNRRYTKEDRRRFKLRSRFNLTPEDYETMLAAQGGCCYFCERTPEQQQHGVLSVDHDHETGRVRGLVCKKHNQALWCFGDNEAGLKRAYDYVRGVKYDYSTVTREQGSDTAYWAQGGWREPGTTS